MTFSHMGFVPEKNKPEPIVNQSYIHINHIIIGAYYRFLLVPSHKLHQALGALEWFLIRMGEHVQFQRPRFRITLVAQSTFVFHIQMCVDVTIQMALLLVTIWAKVTRVRFFSSLQNNATIYHCTYIEKHR